MKKILNLLQFCEISILKVFWIIFLVISILILDLLSIASIPIFFTNDLGKIGEFYPETKNISRDLLFLILSLCIVGRSIIYLIFQAVVFKFGVDIQFKLRYGIVNRELFRSESKTISSDVGNFIHNVQVLGSTVSSLVVQFIQTLADISIGFMLVLFVAFFEPKIFYLFFISFLLISIAYHGLFKTIAKTAGRSENASNSDFLILLKEVFFGIKEVKQYSVGYFFQEKFDYLLRQVARSILKIKIIGAGSKHLLEISFIAVIGTFYVLVGKEQTADDFMSSLGVLAVVGYRLIPAFRSGINFWVNLSNQQDAFLRLEGFFQQATTALREYKAPVRFDSIKSLNIVVDRLSVKTDQGRFIFRDKSFAACLGEFVAIMGESGSGKTTFLNCISGFKNIHSGTVSLEGNFERDRYRDNDLISYLPQEPAIFSGSVLSNICFSEDFSSIDFNRFESAFNLSGCCSFLSDPGICSQILIGENGSNFSGGQIQRICLARCIYFGRPILLIDEGANKLDKATRVEIYEALRLIAAEGKIVVAVAHDQEIEKYATRVVHFSS